MKKETKRDLVLAILWMAVIFIHSAMPGDLSGAESGFFAAWLAKWLPIEKELLHLFVRKGAHLAEFLILGVLLQRLFARAEFRKWPEMGTFARNGCAFFCGVCYAVTDEVHQLFVDGRAGQVRDVLIDAAGVLLGVLITHFARRNKQKSGEKACKIKENTC
ncbi:MAG: VanZ family protein [Lachnospiraceae bacterium]|nr:VanZ family protein [Lachnospiraceae bacterium]